eukprot:scaffold1055_cov165-Amphora_coffeaeformis.AAC.6
MSPILYPVKLLLIAIDLAVSTSTRKRQGGGNRGYTAHTDDVTKSFRRFSRTVEIIPPCT